MLDVWTWCDLILVRKWSDFIVGTRLVEYKGRVYYNGGAFRSIVYLITIFFVWIYVDRWEKWLTVSENGECIDGIRYGPLSRSLYICSRLVDYT